MKRWLVLLLVLLVVIAAVTFPYWRPLAVHPKHPPNNHPWKLVSYDRDNRYGTYLGNGFISTRIMGEGVGRWKGKLLPCYMAGLYDDEKMIPCPTWSDLRFYAGKARFAIDKRAPYKQVLDLKNGILTTHATWRAGSKTLNGKIELIVSRTMPGVGLIQATLNSNFGGVIRATGPLGSVAKQLESLPGFTLGWGRFQSCDVSLYRTKHSRIYIGIGTMFRQRSEIDGRQEPSSPTSAELRMRVRPGKNIAFAKIIVISSAADESGVRRRMIATLASVKRLSISSLVKAHKAAWQKLWQKDIIIDGPAKDQQAVHSCMFYILQSIREGSRWSIPPMGLSSDAFSGHIFWDADLWIFPALILQHPQLAWPIVEYRFRTLPGALANAKASGHKGAEYAWESGYTGVEDTPPGLNYRHERHINGDVALAQWQYYLATGDKAWLRSRGFPILKATADYWVSRVTFNSAKQRYEILKVVPPDENAELVNNSVYTNAIAKMNLELAARAARIVGSAVDPRWFEVASKMYIPFDASRRRFVAFDGYRGFRAKQADTELLAYPLQFKIAGQDMTEIYRNTLRFYQPRVMRNGPAMSSSAHCVIAARLGDSSGAYKFWCESYAPYLRGPFNYFNEKRSRTWEQMCFLTGAAGPIQAALFGLAGIRMNYDDPSAELAITPCLPKAWRSLKITGLTWRGKTFDVVLKHDSKPVLILFREDERRSPQGR